METILIILTVSALNVVCFFIGAKVGQTVSNGERLSLPRIDLTRPLRERDERKELKAYKDRQSAILRNIDRYDGTSNGQEEIPRG